MDKATQPATADQALTLALTAADHLRKYLPADEKLTESDKMAIAMLERAKRFSAAS